MTEQQPRSSVVVGIDGSQAAIHAAEWAVEVAVAQDLPLRLVFVIGYNDADNERPADDLDREYARDSLMKAHEAVIATERPVKVETEVLQGHPVWTLSRLSRSAHMMCVGSVGIGYFTDLLVGSTAAELARSAHCPVAIIRPGDSSTPGDDWIAVVVDDSADSEAVLGIAAEQARLRHAGLLAIRVWRHRLGTFPDGESLAEGNRRAHNELELRLTTLRDRQRDLRIHSVAVHGSVTEYLSEHNESIRLVVVGATRGGSAGQLVGPVGHALMHHANCSVLVVRQ